MIDCRLVAFAGQGAVSVGVLLDENNTGNRAVSMFEVKIAAGRDLVGSADTRKNSINRSHACFCCWNKTTDMREQND